MVTDQIVKAARHWNLVQVGYYDSDLDLQLKSTANIGSFKKSEL